MSPVAQNRVRTALITAAMLALLAVVAAWFLRTHERVTVEIPLPWRGEARQNPFLAAERLLQRLEFDADSHATLIPAQWLPDVTDTLFVPASTALAEEETLSYLDWWVLEGGHLVLLAPDESNSAIEALFEHFAASLHRVEGSPSDDPAGQTFRFHDVSEPEQEYVIAQDPPFRFGLYDFDGFDGPAIRDDRGFFLTGTSWGDGFVTFIGGISLFDSANLARADHGRLLLHAVAGTVEPGKVWFVYDIVVPPLWRVIWERMPFAVMGGGIALLLWLAAVMPRFGPIAEAPAPNRRSILEHVEAAARFIWRNGAAVALIEASRTALLRRAEVHRPGIARRPVDEQAQVLAELSGLSADTVHQVLVTPERLSAPSFIATVQKLQAMRNAL